MYMIKKIEQLLTHRSKYLRWVAVKLLELQSNKNTECAAQFADPRPPLNPFKISLSNCLFDENSGAANIFLFGKCFQAEINYQE